MKHTIPVPIQRRVVKHMICGVCITGFGLIWSLATKDKTTCMLSMAVALVCVMKVTTLYRTSRDVAYDDYEGTMLTSTALLLRKRQEVTLQQEGGQISIVLEGRTKFALGSRGREFKPRHSD